jgi:ubiquinol-cytochrome c reductase cytochrome b subunit
MGRTEKNVVGSPMFPVFMAKTTGFLFIVSGITALLGALAQVNPIWQFGPYDAARISYAVQPDWYMGFLDGALRIFPSWSFMAFGHTVPLEVTIPAVIFPGIIFNIAYLWPMLERKFTKDNEIHHLLDRPSDRPKRTAAGVAVLVLLSMLHIASSTDVIANFFHLSLNQVLWGLRILVVILPIVAYPLTYKICKELQGVRGAGKRKTPNIVSRTAEGEYVATPTPAYGEDVGHELEATPVPAYIEDEPEEPLESGVRTVDR